MAAATLRRSRADRIPGHPHPATDAMATEQAVRRRGADPGGAGLSGQLVDDWTTRRSPRWASCSASTARCKVYLDACVHCGACTDKCQYFLGTGDPKNMPVARQDLMRKVYRRYFTFAGKMASGTGRRRGPDARGARRMVHVLQPVLGMPALLGVLPLRHRYRRNHHGAREILDAVGMGQKYTNEIIGKVHKSATTWACRAAALADTLEGLEEEIQDETGVDVTLPLDEKGAEVLLVTPSADFFAEPHVDSLIGYAKVFHAAGISWTLSSHASEAANFGLFIGSYEQMRAGRAAGARGGARARRPAHRHRRMRPRLARRLQLLEHADRAVRFPRSAAIRAPQHVCELTYDLIQRGALVLDREANDHRVVTFHDSCNVARASRMGGMPGGQFDIPREIIRAVVQPFPRHGARDDRGAHLLLRRRRRAAHRRADGDARQGRAAADGSAQAGGRRARGQLHGDDLRHLQGAVHEGGAVLRIRHEHGRRRAPAGGDAIRLGDAVEGTEKPNDERQGDHRDVEHDCGHQGAAPAHVSSL